MSKNWVGKLIGGQSSDRPIVESALKTHRVTSLSRVLGEDHSLEEPVEEPSPEADPVDDTTGSAAPSPTGGNIEALVSAWQSGGKVAVAQRVLSGMQSYTDLVSLVYSIGQDGAMELGRLMDELEETEELNDTSEESDMLDIPSDDLHGDDLHDDLPPQ